MYGNLYILGIDHSVWQRWNSVGFSDHT